MQIKFCLYIHPLHNYPTTPTSLYTVHMTPAKSSTLWAGFLSAVKRMSSKLVLGVPDYNRLWLEGGGGGG